MILHNRTVYTVLAYLATLYDESTTDTHRNQCVHYAIQRVTSACRREFGNNWNFKKIDGDTVRFILDELLRLQHEFEGDYRNDQCSCRYMNETNTIRNLVEQRFFPLRNKSNG